MASAAEGINALCSHIEALEAFKSTTSLTSLKYASQLDPPPAPPSLIANDEVVPSVVTVFARTA